MVPDPEEMDRAFDDDDDEEHDSHEGARLLGGPAQPSQPTSSANSRMPGDYDFDRDYFLPPPGSPPPFEDYSATNPAPGNSNGIVPSSSDVRRPKPPRHFLGGILPLSFLPRQRGQDEHAPGPGVGGGQSGVFANLSARPDGQHGGEGEEGSEWANENELKDAPPSYQTALRDAVPPYWDTTVVLPSSTSPFGPLSSSISGDEILIDGMPAGNLFGFVWNLAVSAAFWLPGFLLTYVLHTTHAAKHGSRAGLGVTLLRYAFHLRSVAQELLKAGHFPGEMEVVDPATGKLAGDKQAEDMLKNFGSTIEFPQPWSPPAEWGGGNETYIIHSLEEAEHIVHKYNHTLLDVVGQSAPEVGRANEWFSFMLMIIGWFLILASIGGWLRVKRFEYKLQAAQRESEAAQRAARGEDELEPHPADDDGDIPTRGQVGPTQLAYYTAAVTQALNGAREIQRGFFGMRGPRPPARGDTLFAGDDDEQDLLEAQGYGLEPMSQDSPSRRRGLWG
ncbi:metal ion transport-related protein [Trichosporon asahii var. asahii CBS 8904]|uniref:Metal ion transport-related protein n=1 Tax=Trichosporon asahii var. asahii (strain CBS 8904) TaxID=1220162 RepID=K1WMD5_TRIAC|nr:metal ion transport-related protein [Trichosporon asahii var. asahii CBS 8904]